MCVVFHSHETSLYYPSIHLISRSSSTPLHVLSCECTADWYVVDIGLASPILINVPVALRLRCFTRLYKYTTTTLLSHLSASSQAPYLG